MKNYIPTYFYSKQNIILLLWVTALFGELFILFFQPVESRTWVDSDWQFLLWVTIVVLVAVGGIALSRTIMYNYAKKHNISYLQFAIWILLEVSVIAIVYAAFPVVVLREFAQERGLELFYLFKEALMATAFILLIPYALVTLWISLKDSREEIQRLKGIKAYAAVMPSISGKRWDKRLADGLHETVNLLAQIVPIWHLDCLPDEGAARLCCQTCAHALL